MTRGQKALVVLFVLMLPLVTAKIRGADEIQYFSHLRSMVFDRDLQFANEYQHFHDRDPAGLAGFKETFLDKREPQTGGHINFTPVGCALLWSPFYLLAHAGVLLARALGAGVAADGFSLPYVAAVCYGSALYGFLGLLLAHEALRRWGAVDDGTAATIVAALWWGSPLLYYMTIGAGFAHSTSIFTVGSVLWLSLRAWERGSWNVREAAVVGFAGGIAALMYEKEALYLVVPATLLGGWARKTGRLADAARALAAMGAASGLAFAPQLLAYRCLNGTYGPSSLVRRKMIYGSPHFFEVLVDPAHGLFVWTPLAAVAFLGLVALLWRRKDVLAAALVLAFLLQVWICGSVDSWHQAGAFGSRRFVSATPVLAFGLAPMVTAVQSRWGKATAAGLLAVFVWWNVSLMVQFGLRLMDRQGMEWPRVARNQIVEVPRRMGRTLWLFLVDRERLLQETR